MDCLPTAFDASQPSDPRSTTSVLATPGLAPAQHAGEASALRTSRHDVWSFLARAKAANSEQPAVYDAFLALTVDSNGFTSNKNKTRTAAQELLADRPALLARFRPGRWRSVVKAEAGNSPGLQLALPRSLASPPPVLPADARDLSYDRQPLTGSLSRWLSTWTWSSRCCLPAQSSAQLSSQPAQVP